MVAVSVFRVQGGRRVGQVTVPRVDERRALVALQARRSDPDLLGPYLERVEEFRQAVGSERGPVTDPWALLVGLQRGDEIGREEPLNAAGIKDESDVGEEAQAERVVLLATGVEDHGGPPSSRGPGPARRVRNRSLRAKDWPRLARHNGLAERRSS